MRLLVAPLAGIALLLAASSAPGQERGAGLKKLIQDELAGAKGLRPSDGVRIDSARYASGVLRVEGQVAKLEQREAVRRHLEGARERLAKEAGGPINTVDVTGLMITGAAVVPPGDPGCRGPADAWRGRPLPGHWPYNCPPVFVSWCPPPWPKYMPHIVAPNCPGPRHGHKHGHHHGHGHHGDFPHGDCGAGWCGGAPEGW
jgi:hypothetical protein